MKSKKLKLGIIGGGPSSWIGHVHRISAMEKQGYTKKFAAAITAASSVIGPIIPPSGIMIIYAYVMGESVAALFLAGIVPGILVGVSLMITIKFCLLYTSPSPRDATLCRMPSSA